MQSLTLFQAMSPDFPAELETPHGALALPTFLPDATLGVVRALDSADVAACGVQALVMNTFHLMQRPGSSTVQALGGLHAMTGWHSPILTDSGGFQAWSLIRQNPRFGTLTDDGIVFKPEGSDRKYHLTPEKCIQLQIGYGTDVVMCLDDCTHVDDPDAEQRTSVRRTVAWAARCKREFTRLLEQKRPATGLRPLLFAVIQGGGSSELRRECATALLEMGFDGFGYGGWPLDSEGRLLAEMLAYTRLLVPAHFPMHALGVGHPVSIAACAAMGYCLFDSALPTRDARRGRLYTRAAPDEEPRRGRGRRRATTGTEDASWFKFLYIADEKYVKDSRPVEAECNCHTCRTVSRGYLHHLNTANEAAFQRLATIHNLRFMARLMERLRADQQNDVQQF